MTSVADWPASADRSRPRSSVAWSAFRSAM